jgi:hypothetical protein
VARSWIDAFLRSHAEWLARKLDELNLIARPTWALRVGDLTEFPLRGETVVPD